MSNEMVIKAACIHDILRKYVPELFSEFGNKQYATEKPFLRFRDENGEEIDFKGSFEIYIKEREPK